MRSVEYLKNNGVDIDKSLELFGDMGTYNETVGEFLVGIPEKINKLTKYLDNKDVNNFTIFVHSIKSDAKYFGFMKLSNMALEFEEHGKVGDIFYLTEHFSELVTEANKAVVIVREYLNGTDDVEESAPASNNIEPYQNKTILVVDDSNIIRNFVKRIFSEEYAVGTASDGREAIDIITANMNNDNIVAILLDLNMPNVDGFAVLDYMKENNLLKKMPVSIISGDSSKETIDRAFTYGIVDMLGKPFNNNDVKRVIEKTMFFKDM